MSRAYFWFACNDYRNGRNLYRFDTAEFKFDNDIFIHLEGKPTAVRPLDGNRIRVGRLVIPFINYKPWIGNWCWDRVEIEMADANTIAEYLRRQRGFKPDHANTILWDAWKNGEALDFESLVGQVEREITANRGSA